MIIAVDFDGTIVAHDFPRIGIANPGALDALKMWKSMGVKLILWTMRSNGQEVGDVLTEAVEYCRKNGVEFDAVNEGINDRQWTTSQKVNADIYIDDLAIGCPIRHLSPKSGPVVDWPKIMGPITQKIKLNQQRYLPKGTKTYD